MITRKLDSAPRTGGLLVKAALGALPRLPLPLPGRGGRGGRRGRGAELPDIELELAGVRADPEQLAAYARVCGFGLRDELPATYPHVLAFPLALRLLTDDAFPFPMVGSVHVGNTITQHRPLRFDEPLTLRVRYADLRPHDRGTQFDVIHTASVDGAEVWRDVSTYLRRDGSGGNREPRDSGGQGDGAQKDSAQKDSGQKDSGRDDTGRDDTDEVGTPTAVWRVAGDTGRRYAAVSGDHNPIHLYPLAARLFGFRGAIAHGMWSMARCLAALQGRLPAGYTVEVAFRKPLVLPGTVAFTVARTGDGWEFGLHGARSGKPHLAGTVTPL